MSVLPSAIRITPEALRSLAFGSISGTYAGIGTAFANPIRLIHLTNTTDVLITFSFDGVTDHFIIPSNAFLLLDITSNKTTIGASFSIAEGTRIYAKGAPSSGTVYLSCFYGST